MLSFYSAAPSTEFIFVLAGAGTQCILQNVYAAALETVPIEVAIVTLLMFSR